MADLGVEEAFQGLFGILVGNVNIYLVFVALVWSSFRTHDNESNLLCEFEVVSKNVV